MWRGGGRFGWAQRQGLGLEIGVTTPFTNYVFYFVVELQDIRVNGPSETWHEWGNGKKLFCVKSFYFVYNVCFAIKYSM